MPLLFLLPIVGLGGAFLGSLANNATEPAPSVQDSAANISPLTIAVYGATGLGLFWLYRKAMKA